MIKRTHNRTGYLFFNRQQTLGFIFSFIAYNTLFSDFNIKIKYFIFRTFRPTINLMHYVKIEKHSKLVSHSNFTGKRHRVASRKI